MLLCTGEKGKAFAGVFDEVSKALFPQGPIRSPAQRCLIHLIHLQKKWTKWMQWRPGSRTVFSYVLYLYSILKNTRRHGKPLDNIFLDSLSLDFSFSDSSFAGVSSFSKDSDNWIWIFSCQKVKISHHRNYFKQIPAGELFCTTCKIMKQQPKK